MIAFHGFNEICPDDEKSFFDLEILAGSKIYLFLKKIN
jgi:hypothetical protein